MDSSLSPQVSPSNYPKFPSSSFQVLCLPVTGVARYFTMAPFGSLPSRVDMDSSLSPQVCVYLCLVWQEIKLRHHSAKIFRKFSRGKWKWEDTQDSAHEIEIEIEIARIFSRRSPKWENIRKTEHERSSTRIVRKFSGGKWKWEVTRQMVHEGSIVEVVSKFSLRWKNTWLCLAASQESRKIVLIRWSEF